MKFASPPHLRFSSCVIAVLVLGAVLLCNACGMSFGGIDKNNPPKGVQYQESIFDKEQAGGVLRLVNEDSQLSAGKVQDEISMNAKSALSFDEIDKDNLPDGVFYQGEVSTKLAGNVSLK